MNSFLGDDLCPTHWAWASPLGASEAPWWLRVILCITDVKKLSLFSLRGQADQERLLLHWTSNAELSASVP